MAGSTVAVVPTIGMTAIGRPTGVAPTAESTHTVGAKAPAVTVKGGTDSTASALSHCAEPSDPARE